MYKSLKEHLIFQWFNIRQPISKIHVRETDENKPTTHPSIFKAHKQTPQIPLSSQSHFLCIITILTHHGLQMFHPPSLSSSPPLSVLSNLPKTKTQLPSRHSNTPNNQPNSQISEMSQISTHGIKAAQN